MSLDAGGPPDPRRQAQLQSGKWFKRDPYGVRQQDLEVDYDQMRPLPPNTSPPPPPLPPPRC